VAGYLTRWRLRFSLADNDDNLVNLEHFHSGNASNSNLAPKLIITYQVP